MTGIETALVAREPESLAAFYTAVFDLTPEWVVDLEGEQFETAGLGSPCTVRCLLAGDGHRLKLLGPARSNTATDTAAHTGPIVGRAGGVLLSMVVTDLDTISERILAAGGRHYGDGAVLQAKPTVRIAFFADPEGNALEIIERLS